MGIGAGVQVGNIKLRAKVVPDEARGIRLANPHARFKQFLRKLRSLFLSGLFITFKVNHFRIKQKAVHIKNHAGYHKYILQ